MTVLGVKTCRKTFMAACAQQKKYCFFTACLEIIGAKVPCRKTNSLNPYTGVCGFFLSVKFATFLLAFLGAPFLAGG